MGKNNAGNRVTFRSSDGEHGSKDLSAQKANVTSGRDKQRTDGFSHWRKGKQQTLDLRFFRAPSQKCCSRVSSEDPERKLCPAREPAPDRQTDRRSASPASLRPWLCVSLQSSLFVPTECLTTGV